MAREMTPHRDLAGRAATVPQEGGDAPCWAHLFDDLRHDTVDQPGAQRTEVTKAPPAPTPRSPQ